MINRRRVLIDYTNYRGERHYYEIDPTSLIFGSNEWHPNEQWMIVADVRRKDGTDIDNKGRTFVVSKIHSWVEMWIVQPGS